MTGGDSLVFVTPNPEDLFFNLNDLSGLEDELGFKKHVETNLIPDFMIGKFHETFGSSSSSFKHLEYSQ